ncbi:MAG: YggS family pyridoxal phosphate-dependent enzyme [Deltaproteobacteria bacterium]|nr:YggS family pyridoxal phosphate-dependent enzyme [Deltaproteobacteria bacterium]
MSVAEDLARVRDRIAEACRRAGRDPETLRLIAVSKLQPVAKIRAACDAGQLDFGENYGQELRDKATELAQAVPRIQWHHIGPVQSNKVRYIARWASWVHTVDRPQIATELLARAAKEGRGLHALIEINIADEPQKAGLVPAAAESGVAAIAATGMPVRGLMCMPPFDLPLADTVRHFARLRDLAERLAGAGLLSRPYELSMGMSADFEAAIGEGATMVRVGTAIFGEREG